MPTSILAAAMQIPTNPSGAGSFEVTRVALGLGLAFLLSLVSASLYRRLYSGPSYSYSFFVTLIVLPIVVSMIMTAIGSNVALSVGLVGALSIVRFRTVIKDTRDMAFLFLTIGIGLCCGSGAYALAIVGTVFVGSVLIGVHAFARARGQTGEYILVFRQVGENVDEAEQVLETLVDWRKLHGAADLGQDSGCEYTYRIKLASSVTPETMMQHLRRIDGLYDSSLITPESQVAI